MPYWPCWRLYCEGRSWADIQTMSLYDVLNANEVLDAWHDASKPPK